MDALARRLGFGLLTAYGVGVMIGAGIYVLIGAVVALAGEATPWIFLAAGLVALPTALSFAELSSRIPEAGGAPFEVPMWVPAIGIVCALAALLASLLDVV